MVNIDEIVFLVNFDTEDIADIIIGDCEHNCLDEEFLNQILEKEGLSIPKIAHSTASIVHHNKQLNIQFFNNMNLYKVSILDYLEKDLFIELISIFKEPKKIKIIDPSPQIGGFIDKNYGVKFKIQVIARDIKKVEKPVLQIYTESKATLQVNISFGTYLNYRECFSFSQSEIMRIAFMNDRDKIILQDGKFTAIRYREEFQYAYKSGQGVKTSTQCYNFDNLSDKILDTIQNIKNSDITDDPIRECSEICVSTE